jgi:hypothetical protein
MSQKITNRLWRKQSSGMWHRVNMVLTDVSEERIATIFRVEKNKKIRKRKTSVSNTSLLVLAHSISALPDFLPFSSTLHMQAKRTPETSVNTITTRRHIPEDCFLHSHRRDNLRSYIQPDILYNLSYRILNKPYIKKCILCLCEYAEGIWNSFVFRGVYCLWKSMDQQPK